MLVSPDDAIDQITRLERTIGFVKGEEGIAWRNRLVDGLLNACNAHSVGPKPIIDRCLELSKHCPTDFDLHTVAGIIREEMRSQQKAPGLNSPRCNKCNGTGWERVFALHTKEGEGEFTYKRRERITQQVYESLHGGWDLTRRHILESDVAIMRRSSRSGPCSSAKSTTRNGQHSSRNQGIASFCAQSLERKHRKSWEHETTEQHEPMAGSES